jgi:hypothetical protein
VAKLKLSKTSTRLAVTSGFIVIIAVVGGFIAFAALSQNTGNNSSNDQNGAPGIYSNPTFSLSASSLSLTAKNGANTSTTFVIKSLIAQPVRLFLLDNVVLSNGTQTNSTGVQAFATIAGKSFLLQTALNGSLSANDPIIDIGKGSVKCSISVSVSAGTASGSYPLNIGVISYSNDTGQFATYSRSLGVDAVV